MRAADGLVGLAALLVLTGGVDAALRTPPTPVPPPASPAAVPAGASSREAPEAPELPLRLALPALGVDRDLVPLGLAAGGGLDVPADPDDVGVWTGPGPVVLAGHVDSLDGPAVFHGLERLRPGDPLLLTTTRGVQRWTVASVERVAKAEFPTFEVFTGDGLHLVTCGGRFDRTSGSYDSNVVVRAVRG